MNIFCSNFCNKYLLPIFYFLLDFLPPQIIYGGKAEKCHPVYKFPSDWHITHSKNHWANTDTQMDCIKHVILLYIRNIKRISMSKIIRILSEMGSEKRVLVTFSRMNFRWHRCQDLSNILIHSGTFKCCDHDLNILTCISSTF